MNVCMCTCVCLCACIYVQCLLSGTQVWASTDEWIHETDVVRARDLPDILGALLLQAHCIHVVPDISIEQKTTLSE